VPTLLAALSNLEEKLIPFSSQPYLLVFSLYILQREMKIAVATRAAIRPLEALNFFMADLQADVGPFLGIFLLAHGWKSGVIGTVMTIGGVAGMLMTAPAGALIDAASRNCCWERLPSCPLSLGASILPCSGKAVITADRLPDRVQDDVPLRLAFILF